MLDNWQPEKILLAVKTNLPARGQVVQIPLKCKNSFLFKGLAAMTTALQTFHDRPTCVTGKQVPRGLLVDTDKPTRVLCHSGARRGISGERPPPQRLPCKLPA